MAETQMRNQTGALPMKFKAGSNPRPLDMGHVRMKSLFSGVLLPKATKVFLASALQSGHISHKQSYTVQHSSNNWERYPNAGRVQPIYSDVKTFCNISEQTTLTSKAETYRQENMNSLVVEALPKLHKNQHSSYGLHPTGALKCQYLNNMYQWHFLCSMSLE